ncbi:MAG TPA: hypothetical protein PK816_14145 [Candidatus Cloacimonadota bacterium]|nr:hypothetical protein [Candidatus Cloacimonadota bacterium]
MKREQIIELIKKHADGVWNKYDNPNQPMADEVDIIKLADAILALPLDVPSDEEIENKISTIFRREALTTIDYYSTGFNEGTIWMREEIIKRNK